MEMSGSSIVDAFVLHVCERALPEIKRNYDAIHTYEYTYSNNVMYTTHFALTSAYDICR